MNFMKAMSPEEPENRFVEYLFNRFGADVPKEYRYQFKAYLDSIPYDEKYNRVRKMNPDEDLYYIRPVCTFEELYNRKKQLNEATKNFIKQMKDVKEKMQEIVGMIYRIINVFQ